MPKGKGYGMKKGGKKGGMKKGGMKKGGKKIKSSRGLTGRRGARK